MGVYLAQVVKAFTASGPGQLSLKIGDVIEVQTGDNAWSLGHVVPQASESLNSAAATRRANNAGNDGWFPSVCIAPIPASSDGDQGAVIETRPALHDGQGHYHPSVSATISASVQLSPSTDDMLSRYQGNTIVKDGQRAPRKDSPHKLAVSRPPWTSQYPLVTVQSGPRPCPRLTTRVACGTHAVHMLIGRGLTLIWICCRSLGFSLSSARGPPAALLLSREERRPSPPLKPAQIQRRMRSSRPWRLRRVARSSDPFLFRFLTCRQDCRAS